MMTNDKFLNINIRDYQSLGNDDKAGEPIGYIPCIFDGKGKLLDFYKANRFSQFDTRQTASDTDEQHELVQLLRML